MRILLLEPVIGSHTFRHLGTCLNHHVYCPRVGHSVLSFNLRCYQWWFSASIWGARHHLLAAVATAEKSAEKLTVVLS